jgi:hypothetical protein
MCVFGRKDALLYITFCEVPRSLVYMLNMGHYCTGSEVLRLAGQNRRKYCGYFELGRSAAGWPLSIFGQVGSSMVPHSPRIRSAVQSKYSRGVRRSASIW